MRLLNLFAALGWLAAAFRLWQILWEPEPLYAMLAIIACVYCSINFLGKALGVRATE